MKKEKNIYNKTDHIIRKQDVTKMMFLSSLQEAVCAGSPLWPDRFPRLHKGARLPSQRELCLDHSWASGQGENILRGGKRIRPRCTGGICQTLPVEMFSKCRCCVQA